MVRKRIQLALIHVAVAMTLVPINSTLNRIMIKELAISATLVAVLASLPYLFSPTQVLIGGYSDRHPIWGWRRSPYILVGLLLCVGGVAISPTAVFWMVKGSIAGFVLSLLAFGAWGMGFNIASVAYLSLAAELSGEKGRSKTISLMWFVMIVGIIATSITLSRLLTTYSQPALVAAFQWVGLAALGLGLLGIIGLEPRAAGQIPVPSQERAGWNQQLRSVLGNPQARRFFFYLIILLAAILGQDILLEPYAGQAFGLSVSSTTRITSIWGVCVLIALLAASLLERRVGKRRGAEISAWAAAIAFGIVAVSGPLGMKTVFYAGVVLLGLATGLSTVTNLSLMLDMTTNRVGLFIGAWGMADALARLVGNLLSGVVRDVISQLTQNLIFGYVTVFVIEAVFLLVSIVLLRRIDVGQFRKQAEQLSLADRATLLNET